MARPGRFELPTPWFEAKYSIQLSYGRLFGLWLNRRGALRLVSAIKGAEPTPHDTS